MWYNRVIQLSKYGAVSSVAIGIGYRMGQSNGPESSDPWSVLKDLKAKPGMPIFGSVSAATAISRDLATVQTSAEVDVPKKELGIPAEPLPGQSRIMEIMRFGFPGLDNIRSHR